MNLPAGTMLTVRRITEATDGLGDTTRTVTTESWGPCAVAPRFANESADPTAPRVVVGLEIYGPPVSLTAADEIVIDGEVWQVDGRPEIYAGAGANPFTGWQPGACVRVKRAGAL